MGDDDDDDHGSLGIILSFICFFDIMLVDLSGYYTPGKIRLLRKRKGKFYDRKEKKGLG